MIREYPSTEPPREELERRKGPVMVEFGAAWCGICQAAQPSIAQALNAHPAVEHVKVADGKGQPLGRSYRVKLWPTLIALRDGKEVARLVRPTSAGEISNMLDALERQASAG